MYYLYKIMLKILRILHLSYFLSDINYLKMDYQVLMHKKLNLKNPKTFNEKLQWLKLYNRKPEYSKMVDKFEVKNYVASIIGEEHIIHTIGVYNSFDEIDFENLPNKFVIKCTHDSGGVIICKDKSKLDIETTKKQINKALKTNYYKLGREWPYKNVKPRIIIEKFIQDSEEDKLKDYKLFCFNGKVKMILVCSNRIGNHKNTNFYDISWNLLPFSRANHINNPNVINKPNNLEEMIKVAEKLSKNIPFVRVDLYDVNNKVYFGELTFYPSSGFEGFNPEEWDIKLGDMLELPIKNVEEKK